MLLVLCTAWRSKGLLVAALGNSLTCFPLSTSSFVLSSIPPLLQPPISAPSYAPALWCANIPWEESSWSLLQMIRAAKDIRGCSLP